MKRKLAIWLKWEHWSEYHSRQLAAAIADRYDTTITYKPLDWDEFDVVLCFFPGPNRNPECEPEKIVKCVWERHEYGMARDAGTILAASTLVRDVLATKFDNVVYMPWGINPDHFFPQPMPPDHYPPIVGWAGCARNPRKRFEEIHWAILDAHAIFKPSLIHFKNGKMIARLPSERMHEYYAGIHVYVCGSHSEGFHFPFIEAAACARPIITFNIGCARDLQDTGAPIILVNDFEQMSQELRELSDPEWIGTKNANAIERAWTWDKLRDGWMEMLDNAG